MDTPTLTSSPSSLLRDYLLSSLNNTPSTRTFHIHALTSIPKRHTALFPHSTATFKSREKIYQQDYLILLSESSSSKPPVLVTAIEANLYILSSCHSSILYISKVDSTGQGQHPRPTRALVSAFLRYFLNAPTRLTPNVRIQLFARAQSQYLFPNSSAFEGKKALSDTKLCKWWQGVLDGVASDTSTMGSDAEVSLYYLLPGYTELEAINMLRSPSHLSTQPNATIWKYQHPYTAPHNQKFMYTLGSPLNIFDTIPTFSDDPKSRFLDELFTTFKLDHSKPSEFTPTSPARKRQKTGHADEEAKNGAESGESIAPPSVIKPTGAMPGISMEEFWERMGFRQECSMGNTPMTTTPRSAGQLPPMMLARITSSLMNLDFSTTEQVQQATTLLQDSIKGLCKGLAVEATEENLPMLEETDRSNNTPSSGQDIDAADPFADGSEHMYEQYIYGKLAIDNPPLPIKASSEASSVTQVPQVNVLQVRKKKRPIT